MNDGPLVWIDCEMTGLDLEKDALVELAVLVTDGDLNILGDGVDVVIRPPAAALDQMGDFVREMHVTSGLLGELDSGISLEDAQAQALAYIRQHVPEPGKAPLAGNSIATDRGFVARDLPELDAYLHYRMIDVSSIKELARRWFPRAYYNSPEKNGGHRALADIQESIQELQYYRRAVFVPPPGPDSDTARAIAAEFGRPAETDSADSAPQSAPG
ncbi:MAG: oligoribonuclease [Actinomycetota bacterium]|nr:oligoribonuclease [Actinomycetota bacterium]MDH4353021.1 oligoribonuclease [Actinomycetota bacterium]